jgi:hypothetical protein
MPFNISTFSAQISDYGFLTPNKFQLIVTPPRIILNDSSEISNQLKFRVEGVIAPSINLTLMDVNRYGVGPVQKNPVNATFNTMSLTFVADSYSYIWNFWYQWIQQIFGFSGTQDNLSNNRSLINTPASYSLKYKEDYVTNISLQIFDTLGNISQTINYNQAYPFAISDTQLNWGETNQLLKINIGIAFTDYVIVGATTQKIINPTQ